MKQLLTLMLALLLSAISSAGYAQKLSVGFTSGINISDIHILNDSYSGKWKYNPGPSEGIFLDYSIARNLGLQTGASFSTVYYEHQEYNNYYYPDYYPGPILHSASSSLLPYYWPYHIINMMNFSFLTIPLQVRITVPTRPQLNLAAGAYYSFWLDSNYEYDFNDPENKKNDLGFIYSAGLAYPVSGRLDAMCNIRYITGRREIPEFEGHRHGSADFSLGLAYNIIPGKADDNNRQGKLDTINKNIYLAYRAGLNFSWNSGRPYHDKYSVYAGPSLGFNIGFEMSPGTYFRTGISFERQGYALKDSSDVYHRYFIEGDANYYVRTRVSTDYILIPALFEFYLGEATQFYFNTGPYIGIKLNARCSGTSLSDQDDYFPYYETARISADYMLSETTVYDDLGGLIQNTDIGWVAGAGLVLPLPGDCSLDIGLQFRQGFYEVYNTDIIQEELRPERGEAIIRNSSLTLHAGLRLPVYK